MSRGMRLMVMMLILLGVVVAMMQCAKKTMAPKKAEPRQDGLAPYPAPPPAG